MDDWQSEYVTSNGPALLQNTACTVELLAWLSKAGILSRSDNEQIEAKQGELEKVKKLYDIVVTRTHGYLELMNALQHCRQDVAHGIVKDGVFQKGLPRMKIHFSGSAESLQEIFKPEDLADVVSLLISGCRENELVEMCLKSQSDNTALHLVNSKVPDLVPCYIPRTFSHQIEIRPEIFQSESPDIFVFRYIEITELMKLARQNSTALSSTQLNEINCRFIDLECASHWEIISRNTSVPVHLIKFESAVKKFWLEETTGNLSALQDYFLEGQNMSITEEDLLEAVNSTSGVYICGPPGMGKSELFISLAWKMTREQQDHRFVVRVELQKIVNSFNRQLTEVNNSEENVALGIILQTIATTKAAGEILQILLKRTNTNLVIFLDGFDDVDVQNLECTKSLLRCLLRNSGNIHVCMASRPEHRMDLESVLGLSAYNLTPFTLHEQNYFLASYWKHKLGSCREERLQDLASVVLRKLKKNLKDENINLIGIPLYCQVIAELLNADARRISNDNSVISEETALAGYNLIVKALNSFNGWRGATSTGSLYTEPVKLRENADGNDKDSESSHYYLHNFGMVQYDIPIVAQISAMCATYPVYCVRTLMQLGHHPQAPEDGRLPWAIFLTPSNIKLFLRHLGYMDLENTAFFRGIVARMLQHLVFTGVSRLVSKMCRWIPETIIRRLRPTRMHSYGAVHGTMRNIICTAFATILSHPFHVVAVKTISDNWRPASAAPFYRSLLSAYSGNGCFSGLTPRLLGHVLYVAIFGYIRWFLQSKLNEFKIVRKYPIISRLVKTCYAIIANIAASSLTYNFHMISSVMVTGRDGMIVDDTTQCGSWFEWYELLSRRKQMGRGAVTFPKLPFILL